VRKPISITVRDENLLWLRAQAAATTRGNVSEVLDRLVQQARTGGVEVASRSVVGTIDLPSDEAVSEAESDVRAMFDRSLRPPVVVKAPRARRRARRG
jgi:hypothetical protein